MVENYHGSWQIIWGKIEKEKDISPQIILWELVFLGSTCIWTITELIHSPCPQGSAVRLMCTLERALIGVPAERCAPSRWHLPPFLWPLAHPKLGELAELGGLGELGWRDPPPLGHLWVSLRNPFQLACAIPSGMFWSHFQALACKQQFQQLILMRISLLREANIARNLRP